MIQLPAGREYEAERPLAWRKMEASTSGEAVRLRRGTLHGCHRIRGHCLPQSAREGQRAWLKENGGYALARVGPPSSRLSSRPKPSRNTASDDFSALRGGRGGWMTTSATREASPSRPRRLARADAGAATTQAADAGSPLQPPLSLSPPLYLSLPLPIPLPLPPPGCCWMTLQ